MNEEVLAMHLDLKEDTGPSRISTEAVVKDGEAKLYLNVSWDSAAADELAIEINESSVSKIITSGSFDTSVLLKARKSGIMFDSVEAALGSKYGNIYSQLIRLISTALSNTGIFKKADVTPAWYAPAV